MNYLWSVMILTGVVYGILTGNLEEVTKAVVDSGEEAVSLCISMAGVVAMWSGLMKIAEMTGLVEQLAGRLRPILKFLFPRLEPGSKACKYISLNFLSNFLGLGWASTPAGLKAIEELGKLGKERRLPKGVASNEMCTFLIINISSLQLIPVNIIAYRSQYGSVNPAAIVGPAILTTAVSTVVAAAFCKLMDRR